METERERERDRERRGSETDVPKLSSVCLSRVSLSCLVLVCLGSFKVQKGDLKTESIFTIY